MTTPFSKDYKQGTNTEHGAVFCGGLREERLCPERLDFVAYFLAQIFKTLNKDENLCSISNQ